MKLPQCLGCQQLFIWSSFCLWVIKKKKKTSEGSGKFFGTMSCVSVPPVHKTGFTALGSEEPVRFRDIPM